jgi:exopolysaccharide biosynthesis polyprenyl glycosylphosphotransferase
VTADVDPRAAPADVRRFRLAGNTVLPIPGFPADGQARAQRRARAQLRWIPAILLCADLAAYVAAMLLVSQPTLKTLGVLLLVLTFFHLAGLYRPRLSLSVLDDTPSILGNSLAAGAAAMVLGGLDDGVAGTKRLVTCALFGVLCLATRAVAYAAVRAARRRLRLRRRALFLGAGTVAGRLAEILADHPEYGLEPVGMLDDDPLLADGERRVPVVSGCDRLSEIVREQQVDVIIVTYGSVRDPLVVPLLRTCDRLACEILFVPRLYEVHSVTRDTEVLWGMPLVRMRRAPFRTRAWTLKRMSDVVISALLLLVIAPVLLVCALMSWWETGSVLFRQERVGMDGRPFMVLKFCSLRPDAASESATRWSIGQDDRVRRMGRFLRRTSLDELPQLWNVLSGDMSLVGPRPERPYFVNEFTRQYPRYPARHRVPAGLTGWAQIHGLRGDTSIADRAGFDNFYIENWSLWGDIKIMLRTAAQIVKVAGR